MLSISSYSLREQLGPISIAFTDANGDDQTFAPGAAPVDPFAGLDLTTLYDGIEILADRAELVHVTAHHVGHDGAVGPIDLPRALGILRRHGYRGPLTIEYEAPAATPGPTPAGWST